MLDYQVNIHAKKISQKLSLEALITKFHKYPLKPTHEISIALHHNRKSRTNFHNLFYKVSFCEFLTWRFSRTFHWANSFKNHEITKRNKIKYHLKPPSKGTLLKKMMSSLERKRERERRGDKSCHQEKTKKKLGWREKT